MSGSFVTIFGIMALLLSMATPLAAQESEAPAEDTEDPEQAKDAEAALTFEELPVPEGTTIGGVLINGTVMDRARFPAIRQAKLNGFRCTASLIGPETLLLAAHCLVTGTNVAIGSGLNRVTGTCDKHPEYVNSLTSGKDVALCDLSRPITGITYETISFNAPGQGSQVVLSGYGCTAQGVPSDSQLRLGVSDLSPRPTGHPTDPGALFTAAPVAAGSEAALCTGDSGGPLFQFEGQVDDPRTIIAINAAARVADSTNLSFFASLEGNRSFIEGWVTSHGHAVCGIQMLDPAQCQ